MIFNSIEFIIFFIVVTHLFFMLKHKYRWALLLLASCFFYMFFKPVYILILFGTIIIDYYAAIYIDKNTGKKRKYFLVMSLIANIGVLAVFKYYNFFIDNLNWTFQIFNYSFSFPYLNILLPIGLSFHTFQAMSYTIEVYRGNFKPEKHFGIYSLYVMFYPQLVAGPIERPQHILPQLHREHTFNYANISSGLKLMLWGMFKKVVIADRLSLFVNKVYDDHENYYGISLWVAAIFFSFQIYFDFSGYSDIAIGSAKTMGFDLMQNFNRPYSSRSIREFWSRWHISLSTWFRDYLYIPLGGNKVSQSRWMLNIMIVFMISGFWHGASWTFIIWGALHGIYQLIGIVIAKKKLLPTERFVFFRKVSVFFLVTIAWIFFRSESFTQAFYFIKNLFVKIPEQVSLIISNKSLERLHLLYLDQTSKDFFLAILLLVFVELVQYSQKTRTIPELIDSRNKVTRWSFYVVILYSLIFLGVFEKTQFIYFQF